MLEIRFRIDKNSALAQNATKDIKRRLTETMKRSFDLDVMVEFETVALQKTQYEKEREHSLMLELQEIEKKQSESRAKEEALKDSGISPVKGGCCTKAGGSKCSGERYSKKEHLWQLSSSKRRSGCDLWPQCGWRTDCDQVDHLRDGRYCYPWYGQ